MALHTLGTATTSSLQCLPAWSQVIAQADVAAILAACVDDANFASILSGFSFGQQAVLATGSTHSNTTLDTLVSSLAALPLTQIKAGDLVLGIGIPAGTFVQSIVTTTVTLSQAATATATGVRVAFVRWQSDTPNFGPTMMGQLVVPNRGVLQILPGDYVAIDNTGWPILVSGNAVGYAGSQWSFT